MKKLFIAMSIIMICSVSCNDQATESSENDSISNDVSAESTVEITKGKYAVKSGIVEYKTQVMGMEGKQILFFDDYGKIETTDAIMEMMGVKIHTRTIAKDGFLYNLDMENKTGTKTAALANNANIDFENLTDELKKDMNLKKEGHEDFLGKKCEKMSIDYVKMKMKGTFLVYKGVPLKIDTEVSAMKMFLVGEKFDENPNIPADKFEIPAEFKITEY